MRAIKAWECEFCGKRFLSRDKALSHELTCHLHMTRSQYGEWQSLRENLTKTRAAVSANRNEETEDAFDRAAAALAEFEVRHGIIGKL